MRQHHPGLGVLIPGKGLPELGFPKKVAWLPTRADSHQIHRKQKSVVAAHLFVSDAESPAPLHIPYSVALRKPKTGFKGIIVVGV